MIKALFLTLTHLAPLMPLMLALGGSASALAQGRGGTAIDSVQMATMGRCRVSARLLANRSDGQLACIGGYTHDTAGLRNRRRSRLREVITRSWRLPCCSAPTTLVL